MYPMLTPEQYNFLARHISQTENAIVMTVKDNLLPVRRIMNENMKFIRYSAEIESLNQTNRLRENAYAAEEHNGIS